MTKRYDTSRQFPRQDRATDSTSAEDPTRHETVEVDHKRARHRAGLRLHELVPGLHDAEVIDFTVESDRIKRHRLRATWSYRFESGPLAGETFHRFQAVSQASEYHFVRALAVFTGTVRFATSDFYDAESDEAGPVRDAIVGSRVRVQIQRGRYTDVDPVQLLSRPGGR